jgi:hypothetical protein
LNNENAGNLSNKENKRDERYFEMDPLHTFIATFYMPLFFMISEFFFTSSFNLGFKEGLWEKLPYVNDISGRNKEMKRRLKPKYRASKV